MDWRDIKPHFHMEVGYVDKNGRPLGKNRFSLVKRLEAAGLFGVAATEAKKFIARTMPGKRDLRSLTRAEKLRVVEEIRKRYPLLEVAKWGDVARLMREHDATERAFQREEERLRRL